MENNVRAEYLEVSESSRVCQFCGGGAGRLYGREDEYYIYACIRCYSLAENKVKHGPKR